MQTFMVSPIPELTAQVLDRQRLGKQRVEALQIAQTLIEPVNPATGKLRGWHRHPAVRMWKGQEFWLLVYGMVMCREWKSRGYSDNVEPQLTLLAERLDNEARTVDPAKRLFDNEPMYASHRSNLLRKAPEHYSQFGWTETPDLPYIWPLPEEAKAG